MSFTKVTGESLVKSVKDGNFRELKNNLEEEIVEKVTSRVSEQKEELLKKIRNKKVG